MASVTRSGTGTGHHILSSQAHSSIHDIPHMLYVKSTSKYVDLKSLCSMWCCLVNTPAPLSTASPGLGRYYSPKSRIPSLSISQLYPPPDTSAVFPVRRRCNRSDFSKLHILIAQFINVRSHRIFENVTFIFISNVIHCEIRDRDLSTTVFGSNVYVTDVQITIHAVFCRNNFFDSRRTLVFQT